MRGGLDLNDLRLLSYVVDCGGFSAASKALSIPTSTISQRIASLERAAGVGLLRRSTRSLSLTEAGKLMVPHARAIEERARDVQQALRGLNGDQCGTLRILTSSEIAQFALAPILPKFHQQCPRVALYIDTTDRRVDLIGEGYDVEVSARGSSLKDSTLLRRVVARTPWSLAAAPEYLQVRGVPTEPCDLNAGELLYFGYPNDEHIWELQRGNYSIKVALKPSVCCSDMAALRTAAVRGAGIVGLPVYLLDLSLKQGQLISILPEWRLSGSCISIITPPKRQTSRIAKCFTDFVAAELPIMTDSFGGPGVPDSA